MKRTFDVSPWHVKTTTWAPQDKRLQESMTSLANENLGMRGFYEEGYSGKETLEGVYLGGVWFPDKTRVGWWKNGYPQYFGKMINAVNFLKMTIKVDGEQLDLARQKPTDFALDLDMKKGTFTRSFNVKIGKSTLHFCFERFVSIVQKELVGQRLTVKNIGDQPVHLAIDSQIDADVYNQDSNYDEQFWDVLDTSVDQNHAVLFSKTKPNPFGTPQFTVGMLATTKTDLAATGQQESSKLVGNSFAGDLAAGEQAVLEKRTLVATSRDFSSQDEIDEHLTQLADKLDPQSFDDLLAAHVQAWGQRWDKSDVIIEGDDEAQQGIRFNLFQLFSTYYGNDSRLNISPKGFTGEKYGGATYWDTEAYCIPVYLGVADPQVARNLLKYRYQQLDGAYVNAQQQGLNGALFPMVTFNGIECHNEWEITFEEIHRNGDIAFAIYNYTRYTGDKSYVLGDGAKVLVAISRFWADRVHYSQRKNAYMLHGVTGPDEYENNVNNNWYTNLLCQWTLKYTLQVLDEVDAKTAGELGVTADEKHRWKGIVDNMYLPYDEERDIFVEDDDFLDKDLKPVSEIPADQLPLNQHWSWDKILRSPYIKQGDVIQGIWDFIDDFTPAQKEHNFDFYEQYTVHESSLSSSIYSIIAADLGKEDKAVELYERSARLDLDNYNNDTVDGLHITSMTGSWLDIVQGFAGMRVRNGQLHYAPFLPKKWDAYQFRQNFRGRVLEVRVDHEGTHIKLVSGEPLTIDLAGKSVELK
ncbi:MAG TPA: glycoside hydrolase family 65 protein [Candidatus Limosilactobacillus merdipullorum]|uniref:Glycoside hydrolase family 65 protein n=1 Tax=Candidatus Limosilactobacillus merdipullorum TaxID=2838653 RepID=A0A9D1U3J9_9LACO|nr:glycoside hydrolase family 65 protein [Candidatus Limosilactobacillus merdipullorum]